MELAAIAKKLQMKNLTPEIDISELPDVSKAYASDLLSDVLAHAPGGGLLITVQVHMNVVAVALHAEQTAVVFALDRVPDEPTRMRAAEEGICLFSSPEPSFDIAGKLYELGLRGGKE